MIPVLSSADVRALDAMAETVGTPVERLMENAGWAVARAARGMMGGTYGRRVVILTGKGNNGGDGLVAGRVLLSQGAHVTAILTSEPDTLSPLARLNFGRFRGSVRRVDSAELEIARADLVIDALLGVGLSRAPEGAVGQAIRAVTETRSVDRRFVWRGEIPVLSVDAPSGVDADTGAVPGGAVHADRTVTLAGLKPGLLFEPGAAYAGELEVASIGTPFPRESAAWVLQPFEIKPLLPHRAGGSHKRNVGTVLVVAGSRAMPGAAALTAGAAVHAGAGLTVLCAPEDVCRGVLTRVPEITTIPVPESPEGTIDPKALDLIAPRLGEFDAIAVGPGLTTHPATVEFVRALVMSTDLPLVLDADGLNAFAGGADVLRARSGFTVVTPHAGELSRLVGIETSELSLDRLSGAKRAADELACCVVFKGRGTVIAYAGVQCLINTFINQTGGASLAQGGTGDVLTGLVGSFLAFQSPPRLHEAIDWSPHERDRSWDVRQVAAAVALHGLAADRIAARLAPHPANASALIDELGPTMHDVMHG